jgi:hypothetical protein
MMKMVSMKLSKKEAEKMAGAPVEAETPDYGYGTCLRLDKEQIGKLGLGKPAGGDEYTLTAKVFVKEVSVTDRADGEGYESMELQVTDMGLEPVVAEKKKSTPEEMAAGLYPGMMKG